VNPQPKPEPRGKVKARERAAHAAARRQCVLDVWQRARNACERCGRPVKMASTYFREVGHVHETRHRSGGADATNPDECELLCFDCHFDGPSGAHTARR
jgi:5-methylcytosine-specific restriction endonuclease McrA